MSFDFLERPHRYAVERHTIATAINLNWGYTAAHFSNMKVYVSPETVLTQPQSSNEEPIKAVR